MENNTWENYQPTNEAAPEQNNWAPEAEKKDVLAKVKSFPKKLWILIGGLVAAIVAAIVVIGILGNQPTTPIKIGYNQKNNKKFVEPQKEYVECLNGLYKSEVQAIFNILKKADDYKDTLEDQKDSHEDYIDEMNEEYGKNYKYSYKIEDKEKLEKEDLKKVRDQIKGLADQIEKKVDATKDFENDDWDELAEDLELSVSDTKKLVKALDALRKKLKKVEVTAGYEYEIVEKLTGSELDEPDENDLEPRVYKINGRWVSSDAILVLSIAANAI